MKMIRAIIRPDKEPMVTTALAKAGFPALTKWEVVGRGRQQGIQLGDQVYDALAKCLLMVVVPDDRTEEARRTIEKSAFSGNPGDGKIFVSTVDEVYTIRTGEKQT
ncbi:MAG: P-II family nitrogen regulator [Chloroflexi bacterium]|nr:P-II family nitrogen regulator [Chloroflexota bacterium]